MSADAKYLKRDAAIPEKIRARQCDRQAVMYVHQSTLRQVEQNWVSTRLQYGLADRAYRFGWRCERIVVIDDDLGRTGASTAPYATYQLTELLAGSVPRLGLPPRLFQSNRRLARENPRAG